MLLIVGLGNPGKEYTHTRHNLGFEIIDLLDETWKGSDYQDEQAHIEIHAFERDRVKNKEFSGVEYELDVKIKDKTHHVHVGLMKPVTYMNRSGEVVKKLTQELCKHGFDLKENLLIVHDEMDLEFADTKLSFGRGSAQHNGVQSIIDQLGTQEFTRLRLGIGHSPAASAKDYVLSKLTPAEKEKLEEMKSEALGKIAGWVVSAMDKSKL